MNVKYSKYIGDLDVFIPNRSYILSHNAYLYNVKFPDYLSLVGNLAVSTGDNKYALIIWPSFIGDNKYGIQITDENKQTYSIMINRDLSVIDDVHEELIDNNKEQVETLFTKAQEMWGEI
ncbi:MULTISPECIES: hypothetical protein [unclassified Lysinibacillus]|uniref:hypothetical protein n=1 Tax=unclassified Lysinibacillus TaxID=2636778 RepID=UPI00380D016F